MSIFSINVAARVSTSTADAPAPPAANASRQSGTVADAEFDQFTQQPKPLRFPWLNRLSAQLESAARQKPAFASAPQLGDNLDQAA